MLPLVRTPEDAKNRMFGTGIEASAGLGLRNTG